MTIEELMRADRTEELLATLERCAAATGDRIVQAMLSGAPTRIEYEAPAERDEP